MSDVLPPPPPPRGDSGCWKWGTIACGGGCALMAIVVILIIVLAGPSIKKFAGSAMQFGQDAQYCQTEMTALWQKVEQYHTDKSKYPDKLEQLIPKYVPDKSGLKLTTKPNGPAFTYHKPAKDSQSTDVVLEYTLTMTAPDGQVVQFPVRFMKNGQIENSGRINYQYQGGRSVPATSGGTQ